MADLPFTGTLIGPDGETSLSACCGVEASEEFDPGDGDWSVPDGVYYIVSIDCWAGGGNGADAGPADGGQGGGGGGEHAFGSGGPTTPGEVFSYSVGGQGHGTWFGGISANPGADASGTTGGAGGTGGTGDGTDPGGDGADGSGDHGGGGGASGGVGGIGGAPPPSPGGGTFGGAPGFPPGGGGGGSGGGDGVVGNTGGGGAPGKARVTYLVCP